VPHAILSAFTRFSATQSTNQRSMRISQHRELCALLLAVLIVGGCSSDELPSSAESKVARIERVAIDPTTTGSINLVIKLEGPPPERRELDLGREPNCLHGGPVLSEFVVANETGQLANVLVRLTKGQENWKVPAHPNPEAHIKQLGCTYRPHVLAYQLGTELIISNDDDLLHNVHLLPRLNPSSNIVQAPGAGELRVDFHRAELSIPVQCDLHPWMGAWIHVLDHPWFDVTDANGQAQIEAIPPGTYELEILHEKYGRQTVDCNVASNETTQLQLSFTP
jgi:hypothetical protein